MIFKSILSRYILSGLILNGLGFVFFVLLLNYLNFSPIMSISIQYPIIICIYYLMQTNFVFNEIPNSKNLVLFLVNIFFLYFLNVCALYFCTEIINLNALLSQFLITVILALINFIIQAKIVYK